MESLSQLIELNDEIIKRFALNFLSFLFCL